MLATGPLAYPGEEDADLIIAGEDTIKELPASSFSTRLIA